MNSNTLKLVKDTESEENYGIAVAKVNTKLVKEFNSALKEVKKDGTYDKKAHYINGKRVNRQVYGYIKR